MDIHEHQAKELLKSYKIPTPIGKAVFSVEEALSAAKELPGPVYVVKAQIHAGGRGKAGGVKVVKDLGGVKSAALSILGKKFSTTFKLFDTFPSTTKISWSGFREAF